MEISVGHDASCLCNTCCEKGESKTPGQNPARVETVMGESKQNQSSRGGVYPSGLFCDC